MRWPKQAIDERDYAADDAKHREPDSASAKARKGGP